MRNQKMKMCAILLAGMLVVGNISACGTNNTSTTDEETTTTKTSDTTDTTTSTYEYTSEDIDASFDEANATDITFSGTTINVDGTGANVSESTVTISEAGTYILSGELSDGQVIVSADKEDTVRLVLNGIELNSSTSSAIYAEQSGKVIIILAEGTDNSVSDATTYVYESTDETEPDAAIFSKDDLILTGTGSLSVTGNYYNGIKSKDNLLIASGTYNITSVNNAIHGKDSVTILDGNYTIDAEHNAIHSKGNLTIEGGTYSLKAVKKGLHADQLVTVNGGTIDVLESYEGIEGLSVTINGGDINLVASDDGINAANQDDTTTTDTTTTDATGNEQMMEPPTDATQDAGATSTDGSEAGTPPDLPTSTDGSETGTPPEAPTATDTTTSTDTTNGTSDTNETSTTTENAPGQMEQNGGQMPQGGGQMGGGMDEVDEDCVVTITGGTLTINASGDGIDSNGNVYMTGGEVYVNGPTSGGDGALDYNGDFVVSGGTLVAIGSSGMAQSISDTSTQSGLEILYTSTQKAGSVVGLLDSDGNEIISYTSIKDYASFVISTSDLKDGETYTLTSDGTTLGEITLSGISTIVDETGAETTANTMGGGGRGQGGRGEMPQDGQMKNQTENNTTQESEDTTTTN